MKCLGRALIAIGLLAASAAGEFVVVVAPDSLQPAFGDWVALRESQGWRVRMMAPGATVSESIRLLKDLPDRQRPDERLVLILVGDGLVSGVTPAKSRALVVGRYGPEIDIADDVPWGTVAGADAVGRIPLNDANELRDYLARVVRRERTAPTWGDVRLQVAAGVGGFSPVIDAAIEGAATNLVTGLAPAAATLSLQRYDPYRDASHDAASKKDLAPMVQRGGLWVWMGHGHRNQLPGIDGDHLADACGGADIAVLLACYAGDFEAPGRCVAERLLADSNGPLAVVAATRVTMPYGNARFGGELLRAWRESPTASLGELMQTAREQNHGDSTAAALQGLDGVATLLGAEAATLADERSDHTHGYQLLGDPLLALDRTTPMTCDAPNSAAADETVALRGVAPFAGVLRVESRRPYTPQRDDRPVIHAEKSVAAGERFEVQLAPSDAWRHGKRTVRTGVVGREGLAVAVTTLTRTAVRVAEASRDRSVSR
ncbi:hypothetical protein Pla108_35080 [Botrimarina colliarenosi]|uniref:Gingipain domain-containing protein n=1 Tax=Botrimarina colliarenosi TaxID=2528001 RepID=A0A5C6A8L2_9BACT|nr:C25 family cysteine peptidase [Botrimarina colliarenosi]TWT95361.1 hypothetical protein Pla108_35080 [Botrimarina colliarenosi]